MRWLKFEEKEKRDRSLTIRVSEECLERMSEILKFLEKKDKKKYSQADLIDQLIKVAHREIQ